MSSTLPNSPEDRHIPLRLRVEETWKREASKREQSRREKRHRDMARDEEVIRGGTSRAFPPTTTAVHDAANGAPAPPEQQPSRRTASHWPPNRRSGEEDDSGKIVVDAEEDLDTEASSPDGGDGVSDNAVAEVKQQLVEQKAVCETLRHDIGRKDREIKTLKDERDAAELAKATAGLNEIAELKDKHERTMDVLKEALRERRELEDRLEESENRERVLKKQLEEAKEAKRDVEEKLRREENRMAQRSDQVEGNLQGMEGERNGLRARKGAAAGGDTHLTVQIMNSSPPVQARGGERRDSLMSAVEPAPLSTPPTSLRSTKAGRGSGSSTIVKRENSKGEPQLTAQRRRKEVVPKGFGKIHGW